MSKIRCYHQINGALIVRDQVGAWWEGVYIHPPVDDDKLATMELHKKQFIHLSISRKRKLIFLEHGIFYDVVHRNYWGFVNPLRKHPDMVILYMTMDEWHAVNSESPLSGNVYMSLIARR